MRRYPVLEQPLSPGLTTLRDYAEQRGYSPGYIGRYWKQRDGFPKPVGEMPPRGNNWGHGELVYEDKALDAFRAAHADLWGRRPMQRVATTRDLDERITPAEFARQLAGADIAPYQGLEGFPGAGADGTCRLGDLVAYWNTRPIVLTGNDPDEEVTLSKAARILGVNVKTTYQYQRHPGFPEGTATADGVVYRLGDVVDFLNNGRPGKRGPAARTAA
jgi:hypothetical protein